MLDRKHFHVLYGAPLIHLALCLTMMSGLVVPQLQFLGILGTLVTLIDLPLVSPVTIILSLHHEMLALIWMFVAGTLWWYFLSWLLFRPKPKPIS